MSEKLRDECNAKNGESCFLLSNILLNPNNNVQTQLEGIDALKIGCEANHAESCFYLGQEYSNTSNSMDDERKMILENQANIYYKTACSLGHSNSCLLYSINLIQKKDFEEALPYLEVLCNENNDLSACNLAGITYETFLDISTPQYRQYLENSSYYYHRACTSGHSTSCFSLDRIKRMMSRFRE